jgi:hypothetical protein
VGPICFQKAPAGENSRKVEKGATRELLEYGQDSSDPDNRWRATQDIQDVEHEVLGLIDARLGLGFAAIPRK